MHKISFSILCCGLVTTIFGQSDIATSKWVTQPIVIDGKNTEWGQTLNFYDSNTKLGFAIANDSTNIYLCFKSTDPVTQVKIMNAGLKITLITKGKTKRSASISFPLHQEQPPAPASSSPSSGSSNSDEAGEHKRPDVAIVRRTFLMDNVMMDVEGFTTHNGVIPIKSEGGLNLAVNWDKDGNMVYEVAIPIKEFAGGSFSFSDFKEIILDTDVNAIEVKHDESSTDDASSGFGGTGMRGGGMGGGGMRGGGMRGGGMRGGSQNNDRSQLFVKNSFKQKFVLSTSSTDITVK